MRLLKSSGGFTYVVAIVIVSITGILLGLVGQTWTMAMKREREAELLFRGNQIKKAIDNWYNPARYGGSIQRAIPLNKLDDLLMHPGSLAKVRYIRTIPKDPITGEDFEVLRGPPLGGIIGVFSKSEKTPIKVGNFPEGLEAFEGKTKYSEWRFEYQQQAAALATMGTAGAAPTPATSGTTTSPAAGGTRPPATGSVVPPNEDNGPLPPVDSGSWPTGR